MNDTLNVLVVDDEQIVLDSIRKHLRKEPYEVLTALSAEQALELLKQETIHIVLTDLMMPEMDGLEMMSLVKKEYPHAPIIMITGYATINTALQAMQLGAFDYIAKPFTRAELRGVVNRAADVVRAHEANPGDESGAEDTGKIFKEIGEHVWIMLEDDGNALIGAEHHFISMIGRIQTVYLPEVGDEIRQGSVFFQAFTSDMSSHNILAPLSGEVVEVNPLVSTDPGGALQDPYGEGWLIRLKPSKLEEERRILGL